MIENRTRILILRHPSEEKHAKNTVPLLQLSLKNIGVYSGETPADFLEPRRWCNDNKQDIAVLYPNRKSKPLTEGGIENIYSLKGLVLIDGTWRKAYKIWHSNPWLQQLKSFHLEHVPQSVYRRKAGISNSLSTLEATAEALKMLEGTDTQPLIDLLNARQQFLFPG
ncbi:DTW domain-containing protein [Lacimicrobium alkaliphilum]|uniref:tRNA-uridine aminocarboxypropyltransferase n=2 Tax=Lacimicrobium alkaliphilum TaxID=1526571 RepID=A0ABQ1RIM8_9ALTE|nr:DTW domain-containing protein [Lacimicrobium alkaliphilum]